MTCFVTNYCIYNYLLSYSLFAHANTHLNCIRCKFTPNTHMLVSEWDVNIQFDCANVCMIDMKTCFLDKKTLNKLRKKLLVAEVSGLRSTISGTIH